MGYDAASSDTMKVDGVTFVRQTVDPAVSVEWAAADVPAAIAGTLTTRTDNASGVITLPAGHGLTPGKQVAIGWDPTGANVTRAAVSAADATTITFDVIAGANLPVLGTAVMVGLVVSSVFTVDDTGGKLITLGLTAAADVVCSIWSGGGAAIAVLRAGFNTNYIWRKSSGLASPFAGATSGTANFAAVGPVAASPKLAATFNTPG